MNLGVFGGTFDPIHLGHLVVAEEARSVLQLDEVLFIPTGQPWLKSGLKITDAAHRLAMVELAVKSNPGLRSSDMEVRRPGPTYTVDTLTELRQELGPGPELHLILGLDSLADLKRWHLPERIFDLSRVVAVTRPGYEDFEPGALESIAPGASSKVHLLKGPLIGISGTEIRRRVCNGLPIRYWVPRCVESYILERGLYR